MKRIAVAQVLVCVMVCSLGTGASACTYIQMSGPASVSHGDSIQVVVTQFGGTARAIVSTEGLEFVSATKILCTPIELMLISPWGPSDVMYTYVVTAEPGTQCSMKLSNLVLSDPGHADTFEDYVWSAPVTGNAPSDPPNFSTSGETWEMICRRFPHATYENYVHSVYETQMVPWMNYLLSMSSNDLLALPFAADERGSRQYLCRQKVAAASCLGLWLPRRRAIWLPSKPGLTALVQHDTLNPA